VSSFLLLPFSFLLPPSSVLTTVFIFQGGFGELSKLKNLQVLDLGRNSIDFSIEQFYTFILVHLKTLPKLKYLSFEENPVEVKIPSFRLFVINELVKLSYLDWKTITKEVCLSSSFLFFSLLLSFFSLFLHLIPSIRSGTWRV
jgi:Leucine-rich repeat (LRR) protein